MRLNIKFRDRDYTTEQVWRPKRVICKFRDLYDTVKQVWVPKRAIWEFSDWDDTDEQVWGLERSIYEFSNRDNIAEQVWAPPVHFTLISMCLPIAESWAVGLGVRFYQTEPIGSLVFQEVRFSGNSVLTKFGFG